jgi:RNA recognition motif-containing protein
LDSSEAAEIPSTRAQVKSPLKLFENTEEIGMNIYVGNLSFEVSEDELRETFQTYGEVSSANVITDKFTGKSRGFGFVEMPKDEEAQAAIEALNGFDLNGRSLDVNEARPRNDRPRDRDRMSGSHNRW